MKVNPSVVRQRLEASFYTLDIASEVERHTGIRLSRPDSRKQYNGACPYEDCSADTNGFIVWHELTERGNHYHCRVCRRTGDILKLVQDIKGLGFLDACKELGIPNPYREDGEIIVRKPVQKQPKVEQWQKDEMQALVNLYGRATSMLHHERAMAYLAERKISVDLALEHRLGYIPALPEGEKETFFTRRWCDRIIFPLLTPSGEIGYCGRSLLLWQPGMNEDAHKVAIDAHNQEIDNMWDTPESKVFRWLYTYQQGFFNWQAVKSFDTLVFVEGPFDVMACLAAGILNAIPLGTTGIDADMLPSSVFSAVMALDIDGAGRTAAKKLAKTLRRKGLDVEVCTPVDAKDWSAAYRLYGDQGLAPIGESLQAFIPASDVVEQTVEQSVQEETRVLYAPVSLPSLPRKACACVHLEWDAKGKQVQAPCKGKPLENGFCQEHQSSHVLLEIGARAGYPEVQVPFKWKGDTIYRTIYAGVQYWEHYASTLSTSRAPHAREQDIIFLQSKFSIS